MVPFAEWERGIIGREYRNEVVFTGLYCTFGGIVPMIVGWYALKIDVMFCEGMF